MFSSVFYKRSGPTAQRSYNVAVLQRSGPTAQRSYRPSVGQRPLAISIHLFLTRIVRLDGLGLDDDGGVAALVVLRLVGNSPRHITGLEP